MYDFEIDGRLQVTAGVSLLERSGLVRWCPDQVEFAAVAHEAFEISWRRDVDPAFGRLVCWINFSAGAEMMAKGLCLLHKVEIRSEKMAPAYPTDDLVAWSTNYLSDWKSGGTMNVVNYGTLQDLVAQNSKTKAPAALCLLFDAVHATHQDRNLILAAYGLLKTSIRNRDAHAYVPNVRDHHFSLVGELFAKCFNLLVSWLPGGPDTLELWKRGAREFNESC